MPNHRDDFHGLLIEMLPRLRVRAAALTRNRAAADDLVHDAVVNALAARDRFTPGTNFRAWMHRILHNRFISTTRKRREVEDVDALPEAALGVGAVQEDRLAWNELRAGLSRLPAEQRAALLLHALEGMSYDEVAAATGGGVGTATSRVCRARPQREAWLLGEKPVRAPAASRSSSTASRSCRGDPVSGSPMV